ncbi:MAG: prepilin-type N-terminal cleavage/methylation domain-containing protein [Psychromonas sp.]|nr:prepilin-type N-terminal cleavage/methylation domain-containing protein [Psychromonas sp.]
MQAIKQTGFTLVELLIAMVISLTLILACASVYSSLQNSIMASQGLSNAQESLRTAHYLMSRSVRQGNSMTLSGAGPARELIITYGKEAASNTFYGCLGTEQVSGSIETFSVRADSGINHLYCSSKASTGATANRQVIAVGVNKLFADFDTNLTRKGVVVRLAITGMPGDATTPGNMASDGFEFTLAMRQRILLDSGHSGASATSVSVPTSY